MKDKVFKILVDQKPFDWAEQFITGLEIKGLVGVGSDKSVWMKVNGPNDDVPVADSQQIDLSPPGREHFFTGDAQTTEG